MQLKQFEAALFKYFFVAGDQLFWSTEATISKTEFQKKIRLRSKRKEKIDQTVPDLIP